MHDIIQPEFVCVHVGLFVFAGFGIFRLITLKSPVWMAEFFSASQGWTLCVSGAQPHCHLCNRPLLIIVCVGDGRSQL